MQDSVYTPGIFLSFNDFLSNAPSVSNFYVLVDSATKKVQLYQIMEDSSSSLISQAWGLSIRNELYRYKNGQLYAIEKDGNTFVLSKYIDYQVRKNPAFFWRRYVGRYQDDNNPFNDKHIYRAPLGNDINVNFEATLVDMNTGEISIY